VRIQPQTQTADNIEQLYYVVKDEEKHRLLRQIMKENQDMYGIVFCQTKRDVVLLTRKLRDYYPIDCLHGAMQQSDRDQVMDEFRSGKLKLLVSTDIMARGIDVNNLTHVINYSPPNDPESYIHRIGRTARKGETGVAVTFFTPFEKRALELLERRVKMGLQKHPSCELEFEDAPSRPEGSGRYRGPGGGHRPSGQRPGGPSFGGGGQNQNRRPRRPGKPHSAGNFVAPAANPSKETD